MKAERHEQELRRDKLVDEGRKILARATAYKEKVIFSNYKKKENQTFFIFRSKRKMIRSD